MNNIIVKEVNIEEVLKVNKYVIEFNNPNATKEQFEDRYQDSEKLIIVAYLDDIPIGYIVGYDRDKDNKGFYCWMAGVDYRYRRKGALTALMNYQMNWAKSHGYSILRIKTRNDKREMLSFLVKNGFNFISVDSQENIEDNRINLEISLNNNLI